ncbi:TRAP transporter substrate-binding protein [Chloroflexota bacterium]
MKKAILISSLVVVLIVSLILSACSKPEPTKPIELSFNDYFPPVHSQAKVYQLWADEVGKRSNGRLIITHYSGAQLAPPPECLDSVISGIADIAIVAPSYHPGRLTSFEAIELPSGFKTGSVSCMVNMDFLNKYRSIKEVEMVHLLRADGHGPAMFQTHSKPLRTLEDFKGVVIRGNSTGNAITKALGGTGYGASIREAYELLSKGVVEGTYNPPEAMFGFKLAEVVKYVTNTAESIGNGSCQLIAMNKDKWNSLPSDLQKILTEVSEEFATYHGYAWDYDDIMGFDLFQSLGGGREIIQLSASEKARWMEAAGTYVNEYLSNATAMGLPAQEYRDYVLERSDYWNEKAPSADESVDWAKANLPQ